MHLPTLEPNSPTPELASELSVTSSKPALADVAIIGLGYVGLPLALQFARSGVSVLGLDMDPEKVGSLNGGKSYIKHVSPNEVSEVVDGELFSASTDLSRIREVEAIIICVPTPLNKNREPDISYIVETGRAIAPSMRKGTLVVLESTTYPGTTDEDLRGVLEEGSGFTAGKDFHLAFSPEREDPANPDSRVGEVPKLVGGLTQACLEKAVRLYGQAIKTVVPVSSCRVAEAAKLLENIFRSVNIALVNELKIVYASMGIDIWEVIEAAKTKPFGFMAFYPGPGLGGHCIPIDPFYLTWKAREFQHSTRFIELAGEINTAMPDYVVLRVAEALNDRGKAIKGSRILVLGLAYKPNVDDERESPSYRSARKVPTARRHRGLSRPSRTRHSQNARTSAMGRNRICALGPLYRLGIRYCRNCDRSRFCELSGTGRLGAVHCRHPQRHGKCPDCARQGLEGVML